MKLLPRIRYSTPRDEPAVHERHGHHADHAHRAEGHVPLPGAPALRIAGVSVRYPGQSAPALEEVSWTVEAGSRMALLGPNGAGKSTLFKAIMGLVPPTRGEILVHGHHACCGLELVAYLPQRAEVNWRFPISVRRMVLTGRYIHLGWLEGPGADDRRRVDDVLRQLELDRLAERQVGELSGGQQQRALLARTLVQDAALLLLDEPLSAIDATTRAIFDQVLADLKARGKTVIFSTHDFTALESSFDGALYLKDGRVAPPPSGLLVHSESVA